QTIAVCVVDQQRAVVQRKTLRCIEPDAIVAFFRGLGKFQAVVEATASYEWLWRLLEPLADRLVLAHPKKLRIIAESRRKSHRIGQVAAMDRRLKTFAQEAPAAEAEARAALSSVPGVGPVTVDVVISEVADVRRFRSVKDVVAYAGLAPGFRESAGKRQALGI